jgi:hypothetical protein
MNTFERNIKSLIKSNSSLGTRLFAIDGNERYEVFQDPNDPLNVNIFDNRNKVIFYEGRPQDEILAQVDRFEEEFSRYPVIFIYGIANALFVKLLLQNINHTHIIVIEPEIELLYIALNLIDFSTEINKKRVHFFENHEIDFVRSVGIFSDPQIKVFCKTYHLEPNISYYEQYYGEVLVQCNANMVRAIHHVVTGLGNDTTDALIGLEWHLANVSKMIETPTLAELIQKMKTTKTAIIISTGPSLAKQLPLLQTIKEHATLLSVDASLPILEKYGIKPDVVFSIERVAETAEFYLRTSPEFQKGIICAMSSLSHPLLVESVNGATMQMSMRPFGYTRYFNRPEYGYVGIGMSAANMAYEAAFHAKFETIILIGQDLAYGSDGKSHSEGHIFGSLKKRQDDISVEAYGGEGSVQTSVIWNMFRNFFENDIYTAAQEGVTTINATEGGARIHGADELTFSETISRYIDTNVVKEPIILTQSTSDSIEEKKRDVEEKIVFMESYVEMMQKKVSTLFEKVALMCGKLDNLRAKENLQKVDYDALAELMQEIDEIKSKFDEDEFVNIFIDVTQALIVHHELEIAQLQVRPIRDDDDRRLKMIDWIYAHKSWLFALAGIMEAELVAIKRRGKDSRFVHEAKLDDSGDSIMGYLYDFSRNDTYFEINLIVDNEIVTCKTIEAVHPQKGSFSFSIPARFYNDQVHDVMVREKHTGIVLSGMPDRRLFLSGNRAKAEFMESFDHIDSEKIKDLYCKNGIGFLAVKENLEDNDFMGYLKELIDSFSTITLIAFEIANEQTIGLDKVFGKQSERVRLIAIKNIDEIAENIEILILNRSNSLDLITSTIVQKYSDEIFCTEYLKSFRTSKMTQIPVTIKNNREIFGINSEQMECWGSSLQELLYSSLMAKIGADDFVFDKENSLYRLTYFDTIDYVLNYAGFKKNFIRYRQILRRI